MKKSFVALLIGLALIVLISPGIVGRLAEQSMDKNLDWAATETEEVVVTSQGFDRGWFSSEGQHRIEIQGGEIRDILLAYADASYSDKIPALIIDTRLDHGLIPLASMAREKGSLLPGLGSAVSTVSIEFNNGEILPLPGTIYSSVGLTGALRSSYVLGAGSYEHEGATATWGDVDVDVTTNPSTGDIEFGGVIESFAVDSMTDNIRIDGIGFSGEQRPSSFGFRVGPVKGAIDSIGFNAAIDRAIGPLEFESMSSVDGSRVNARSVIQIENTPFQDFGDVSISIDMRIESADGRAIGNIKRSIDSIHPDTDADAVFRAIEKDAQHLLARGLEFHIDKADIAMPQGEIRSQLHVLIEESAIDTFSWPSVLLAMHARTSISLPADLVAIATEANPELGGAIGMGFLQKNGDVYEIEAEFRNGLLTVNGAPMPIPSLGL